LSVTTSIDAQIPLIIAVGLSNIYQQNVDSLCAFS